MIDIVERLRFLAAGQDDPHSVELTAAADKIERLRDLAFENSGMNAVEKLCCEKVAKDNERLREALRKCLPVMRKAHDRIHCLPRTSDTDLAEAIDIALGVARAALREKE